MNNTAIKEALEIIRLAREGEIDNDLRSIRYRIEQLLELEKQQIIDAWVDGGKMISSAKNAEQYFNQNHNQ